MKRDEILDTAKTLINGDRAKDYGDAQKNFECIAKAWNWWLGDKLAEQINPNDVAMMMGLLKMARLQSNQLHVDSYCDLAGYVALAGEVATNHGVSEKVEK